MLNLYEKALRLKRLPRTGWLLAGVTQPESVAEHSFGVALLACMLAEWVNAEELTEATAKHSQAELDIGRVAMIALVHDLAESVITDMPKETTDLFGAEAKHQAEESAIEQLFGSVVGGDEYIALWREYEQRSTAEAKLVCDADKLEMVYQAREYELAGNERLEEFWNGYRWYFDTSERLLSAFSLMDAVGGSSSEA